MRNHHDLDSRLQQLGRIHDGLLSGTKPELPECMSRAAARTAPIARKVHLLRARLWSGTDIADIGCYASERRFLCLRLQPATRAERFIHTRRSAIAQPHIAGERLWGTRARK